MKLLFCLMLVCLSTYVAVCQDVVLGSVGDAIVKKLGEVSDYGTFELNDQICRYQIVPDLTVFTGSAWCPGLSSLTGKSRTDSKSGAVEIAIQDLVDKISREDVIFEQRIEELFKRLPIREGNDLISEEGLIIPDKVLEEKDSPVTDEVRPREGSSSFVSEAEQAKDISSVADRVKRSLAVANGVGPIGNNAADEHGQNEIGSPLASKARQGKKSSSFKKLSSRGRMSAPSKFSKLGRIFRFLRMLRFG